MVHLVAGVLSMVSDKVGLTKMMQKCIDATLDVITETLTKRTGFLLICVSVV